MGGAGQVGRSSIEVVYGRTRLILDSGIHPGETGAGRYPLRPDGDPDFLIVTHAHVDHSGYSPALVREYGCDVVATPPTRDFSEPLLVDGINLTPRGENPPYSNEDVMALRRKEKPVRYGEDLSLGEITLRLLDAGHVLGSAMVHLEADDGPSLLYTGDINVGRTRILSGAEPSPPPVDYLIIESTYGGDEDRHPARKRVEKKFASDISQTIKSGGSVLIPAFALGRAQEVLMTLISYMESGVIPEVPVFIDGMIREINRISSLYWSWMRPEIRNRVRRSRRMPFEHPYIEPVDDRSEILEIAEPHIVVTTSGMLQGGPVVEYLPRYAVNPQNLIYLTGYQVRGTRGRDLLEGRRKVSLPGGGTLEVRSRVEFADFSAHSDQSGLLQYISRIPDLKEVLIVHGEPKKARQLRSKVERRGLMAYVPSVGERLSLG